MMRLPLRGGGANGAASVEQRISVDADATELTVARAELLEPVLARLVGAIAARRDVSVDRLSDAVLVTDAISAAAPGRFADGCVRLGLGESEKGLELRLGPMKPGAAGEVREKLRLPEVGGSLEGLVEEIASEESSEGDYLIVRFAGLPTA